MVILSKYDDDETSEDLCVARIDAKNQAHQVVLKTFSFLLISIIHIISYSQTSFYFGESCK